MIARRGVRAEPGPPAPAGVAPRQEVRPADILFTCAYDELRSVASLMFRRERGDHTLRPTALVHEVYLRLAGQDRAQFNGRTHFVAVAALAMRRYLREHARNHRRLKRGGGWQRIALTDELSQETAGSFPLVDLDEALERLGDLDSRKLQVVALKFFGNLSEQEIAEHLGVARRTVERDWRFAKAWLSTQLA